LLDHALVLHITIVLPWPLVAGEVSLMVLPRWQSRPVCVLLALWGGEIRAKLVAIQGRVPKKTRFNPGLRLNSHTG